jgi:hypothetical protein
MAIGWLNRSTRPDGRKAFGESDNPTVHSKNTRRYGRDGSKGDFPESSTGEQPAKLYRDPVPPSAAPVTHHPDRTPPAGTIRTEGWDPRTGRFIEPQHPHTGQHGSDSFPDLHATTDGAQGQAHSASGGAHGKRSPRK